MTATTSTSLDVLSGEVRVPVPVLPAAGIRGWHLLVGVAIGMVAGMMRFWNLGAAFESSDQCAMARMIHHSFGLRWMLAHDYGPTLPVVERVFSTAFNCLGIPSSEAACRFPVALLSLAQVLVSYPLLRRLGAGRGEASFTTLCVALLPTLVSDGHYAWGYLTTWLFTGTVALWATIAWLDDHHPPQLAVAGIGLFLHCLSNVFAVGLPLVLLVIWVAAIVDRTTGPRRGNESVSGRLRNSGCLGAFMPGFALPCLAALAVIFLSWHWTGGGQLGRLIHKQNHGALFGQLRQVLDLPTLWRAQFGYVFGVIAAAGLIWGCIQLRRPGSRRMGLLSIWALAAAFPLVILTDWRALGYLASYLGSYFIEVIYCAGMLGGVLLWRVLRHLGAGLAPRVAAPLVAGLVVAWLGVGTADECLLGGKLTRLTGVKTGWGNVRPDTGIKATGAYVRKHVPSDCVIMSLHDNGGMEAPVAEYYLGRGVLASYDLRSSMFEPLIAALGPRVDVLIVEPRHLAAAGRLSGFDLVCTLNREGQPVRYIYARPRWSLPRVDEDVATLNGEYDRLHVPRRVPIALSAPPDFDRLLGEYQKIGRGLKSAG
ncbi:MAG TPA: hypothetical protein PKY77_18340 [Phycisphaerae bacterium]|nr:hypothetical protein [Phycisphaerae bacterium]HRY70289.1 hypothetical protein [Phycisphaerae bacterium]HSA27540.1 hypothetical protein [Phycisphaerae bacterium]